MGDTFNITDESGESRLTGLITDPGATSGDVLTVQDDGSIAAEAGGGSQPLTTGDFVCGVDPNGANLNVQQSVVHTLVGGDDPSGVVRGSACSPPMVIGVTTNVVDVADNTPPTLAGIPTSSVGILLLATLWVTDQLGTQVLRLDASATSNPGDASVAIDWTTATPTAVAGSDLAWDGTRFVSSTAGGVFTAFMLLTGVWDE